MDGALRLLFGDNLTTFYTEQERHNAQAREMIDGHWRVTQEFVDAAFDRLTFFGGERRRFSGSLWRTRSPSARPWTRSCTRHSLRRISGVTSG